MGGLAGLAPGYALCLNGEPAMRVTTTYHFGSKPVRVGKRLPVGTVIATTLIPAARLVMQCDSEIQGGVWSIEGLAPRYRMAPTDVEGVGVRVVSEKNDEADASEGGSAWGWNTYPPLRRMTRSGLRIELVKTGPIHPGVLTHVADMQYRVYAGHAAHPRLAVIEHLHYAGQLTIEIIGSDAGKKGQRLS